MPIRLDAEAICQGCGAKARCTFDVDLLMSKTISSPGGAMYGLPDWYYKHTDSGLLVSRPNVTCLNLACSEKCMKALAKESSNLAGEWKRCGR